MTIRREDLHPSLSDPALESMRFLNEAAERFPRAISFAAGRPYENFFRVDDLDRYLRAFCRYLARERGADDATIVRTLFQYGRTKGIIHDLIARNLVVDEGIEADAESIVVTVGCQEALVLVLRTLRRDAHDVLLATSPGYVGALGAARLVDLPVWPVPEGPRGVDPTALATAAAAARAAGKRPRACYLIPDFANPSGARLPVAARHDLLDVAAEHDLLLLEDNPYGLFPAAEGRRLPTLKSLDDRGDVVYLGSLAKTGFPGARVGYVVADQRVSSPDGGSSLLADELAKVKSMLTVNTPPVAQALVGGMLLENGFSLVGANRRTSAVYRAHLRLLLDGLARRFPAAEESGVAWNAPEGGYFVVVTLPFPADDAALMECAERHGVLWTPMGHFYDGAGGRNQLRLSVSAVSPEQIDAGLDRLRAFVASGSGRR
ncbi:PLP-dependent aminotransferase family protein [Streptomyces hainanensis]|uniref:PLP-dependent aminotransferase family protein n=1 Tax=Streptomyces hainanensis TaxID=402648 RepID=A0A4R4TNI9_9ACTN|nr:PLP-dependent aminotransferase family protein [Streptomyces hainanensis]TDC79571.1 PLP-dependent aminotransferase family protein [Streptomyces hainanensis]